MSAVEYIGLSTKDKTFKLRGFTPRVRAAAFIGDLDGKPYLGVITRRSKDEKKDRARVGIAYAIFSLESRSSFHYF